MNKPLFYILAAFAACTPANPASERASEKDSIVIELFHYDVEQKIVDLDTSPEDSFVIVKDTLSLVKVDTTIVAGDSINTEKVKKEMIFHQVQKEIMVNDTFAAKTIQTNRSSIDSLKSLFKRIDKKLGERIKKEAN